MYFERTSFVSSVQGGVSPVFSHHRGDGEGPDGLCAHVIRKDRFLGVEANDAHQTVFACVRTHHVHPFELRFGIKERKPCGEEVRDDHGRFHAARVASRANFNGENVAWFHKRRVGHDESIGIEEALCDLDPCVHGSGWRVTRLPRGDRLPIEAFE